jgi:hypothetical protein
MHAGSAFAKEHDWKKVLQPFKRMPERPACAGANAAIDRWHSCARSAFPEVAARLKWNFFFAD